MTETFSSAVPEKPARGSPAILALLILAWFLAVGFGYLQNRSAGLYRERIANFSGRKLEFLADVTKALVVEKYPASFDAIRYRRDLIGHRGSLGEIRQFLAQAGFLKKYGDSPFGYLLVLNTPALFPAGLVLGFVILWGFRWKRYNAMPGARAMRGFCIVSTVISIGSFGCALILPYWPGHWESLPIQKAMLGLNLAEWAVWGASAVLATGLILRNERSLWLERFSKLEVTTPRWVAKSPLLTVAVGALLSAGAMLFIETRLKVYVSLGSQRVEAMLELKRLKTTVVDRSPTVAPPLGYWAELFDLQALFFSRSALELSLGKIRAETDALKLGRLQAAFTKELKAISGRLDSVATTVAGLRFTLPDKDQLETLSRRRQGLASQGVPSLADEPAIFGALRTLGTEIDSLAARVASGQRSFEELQDQSRRSGEYGRLANSILRSRTERQIDLSLFDRILSEAAGVGPPFGPFAQRLADADREVRIQAEDIVVTAVEGLLQEKVLGKARELLAEGNSRLGLGLTEQRRELERLETERAVTANVAGVQGTWQMSAADDGMAKNYALTRTLGIVAGPRPGTVVVDVYYKNQFKDGLLASRKTIEKQWRGIVAQAGIDGASLALPDFEFSYEERQRRETMHPQAVLLLREDGRRLDVVVGGRLLYGLRRQ